MALQITIPTPYNVDATYWRLTEIAPDAHSQTARVTVAGYATAQHRLDGADPLDTRTFALDEAAFQTYAAEPAAEAGETLFDHMARAAYGYVKTATRRVRNPDYDEALRPDPETNPYWVEVAEFAAAADV